MDKKALIVGTGLGGLSTGLRLAKRGFEIEFVEKNDKPGGRLNQIKKDGFTFDTGPSFFSMPYEFEELMNDCGVSTPFEFMELEPLYTIYFRGNEKPYYIYKDIEKLAAQFETIEPDFRQKFEKYLNNCEQTYNDTSDAVTKQNFDSIQAYLKSLMQVNPKVLPILMKTFWKHACTFFETKEVRQMVSLIAFFLGRTPFDTNAIYTLLSHIEFRHTGYYNVKGGMYKIVEGLIKELKKHHVRFTYNTEIVDFESSDNKLHSLTDQNGKSWKADFFIINADAALFRGRVLKRKKYSERKLSKMSWTMGYLTFYLGVKSKLKGLSHHNYFLGSNYEDYDRNIMKDRGTEEKPYYYVNILSQTNPGCAPEGCEALFFVCPVPNLLYKVSWKDKKQIVQSIIADFSKRINYDITGDIIFQEIYTPIDWEKKFNLYKGAGLGLSHSLMQTGGFRPKNYDEEFKNTFYVGASTIPGTGLPMTVISSKLVTQRVVDYVQNTL